MAALMKLEPLRNHSKPHLLTLLFHSILFKQFFSLTLATIRVYGSSGFMRAEEEESVLL
jgi:hypothetical protein